MKRIISIEMDFDYSDAFFNDILKMITDRIDPNCEVSIRQEIVSDKKSKELQVPSFLNNPNRVISQQEKGLMEAVHKKEVSTNG